MSDEIWKLDATAQAELVVRGQLRASELIEQALERIERFNGELGAVVHLDAEGAWRRAAQGFSSPGGALGGAFAGVPTLLKDLLPYPGMACAFGTRLFKDLGYVPNDPIPYASAIDRAGLVPLGKSATSELGLLGSTETLAHGPTRNPWDLTRSAGGSSGGAAAAVAAGLVPIAHASDGGGSVRIPAAINGVFGFKPSGGRGVPAVAQLNELSYITTDHCISRSVRDSARWLAFTERTDDQAPFSPVGFVASGVVPRLRLGLWHRSLSGFDAPDGGAAALDSAASLLADLGHDVELTEPPPGLGEDVSTAFFTIAGAAVAQMAHMMSGMLGRPLGETDLEPFTLGLLDWHRGLPRAASQQAHTTLERAARAMLDWQGRFDVTVSPVIGVPTPDLGFLSPRLDRETLVARTEQFAGYTPAHNMARAPAMSVPLHTDEDGLPVGVHFAAMPGRDSLLLRLAYQLEQAVPWGHQWPPMALR